MDEIELDNLGEDQPVEPEEGEDETDIDREWRDESIVIISGMNPDQVQTQAEVPVQVRRQGLETILERQYTEDKKNFLKEIGIHLNKGDGPNAKRIFEKLRLNMGKKGYTGAEFENVRIVVQKGKRLVYTTDAKKLAKVAEFKELVEKAELEHQKTPAALVEETLPDITVNTNLEKSVVRNTITDLEHFIDEEAAKIRQRLNNAEEVISYKELRDLLMDIPGMNDENLENGGLETQKNYLKGIAENSSERKAALCRQIIKLCELKEDEIRLRTNQRPKTEEVQSMVEEEAQQNDLTRFERFKQWAKRNLGGISVVAISVAGII